MSIIISYIYNIYIPLYITFGMTPSVHHGTALVRLSGGSLQREVGMGRPLCKGGLVYGAPIAQRRPLILFLYWCWLLGAHCANATLCGLSVLAMGSPLRKGGLMLPFLNILLVLAMGRQVRKGGLIKYVIGVGYGAPIAQRRQYVAYWCWLSGCHECFKFHTTSMKKNPRYLT